MLKYAIPILFLATLGLPAQCTSFQAKVTIQLGKDSTPNPDPACVARKGQVRWCSNEGDWSTDFPGDPQSPFGAGHAHHAESKGRCSHFNAVRVCTGTQPCRFKYTSQVKPSAAKDPEIIIEPGQ